MPPPRSGRSPPTFRSGGMLPNESEHLFFTTTFLPHGRAFLSAALPSAVSIKGIGIGKIGVHFRPSWVLPSKPRASWVLATVRFVACEASFADYRTHLWVESCPPQLFWGGSFRRPVHFPAGKGAYPSEVNKIQSKGTTMFTFQRSTLMRTFSFMGL